MKVGEEKANKKNKEKEKKIKFPLCILGNREGIRKRERERENVLNSPLFSFRRKGRWNVNILVLFIYLFVCPDQNGRVMKVYGQKKM